MTRGRPLSALAADVDLTLEHLAWLMADTDGDRAAALQAIACAARSLARSRRREMLLDEERPVAVMGSWSLDHGMLPNVVLGEN